MGLDSKRAYRRRVDATLDFRMQTAESDSVNESTKTAIDMAVAARRGAGADWLRHCPISDQCRAPISTTLFTSFIQLRAGTFSAKHLQNATASPRVALSYAVAMSSMRIILRTRPTIDQDSCGSAVTRYQDVTSRYAER
jgi:hypothetical protein